MLAGVSFAARCWRSGRWAWTRRLGWLSVNGFLTEHASMATYTILHYRFWLPMACWVLV